MERIIERVSGAKTQKVASLPNLWISLLTGNLSAGDFALLNCTTSPSVPNMALCDGIGGGSVMCTIVITTLNFSRNGTCDLPVSDGSGGGEMDGSAEMPTTLPPVTSHLSTTSSTPATSETVTTPTPNTPPMLTTTAMTNTSVPTPTQLVTTQGMNGSVPTPPQVFTTQEAAATPLTVNGTVSASRGFPLTETSITGAIVSVVSFISGVLLGYCVRKRRQRQSYNIRQAVAMTGRYATGAAGVTLDDLSVLRNKSKRSSPEDGITSQSVDSAPSSSLGRDLPTPSGRSSSSASSPHSDGRHQSPTPYEARGALELGDKTEPLRRGRRQFSKDRIGAVRVMVDDESEMRRMASRAERRAHQQAERSSGDNSPLGRISSSGSAPGQKQPESVSTVFTNVGNTPTPQPRTPRTFGFPDRQPPLPELASAPRDTNDLGDDEDEVYI